MAPESFGTSQDPLEVERRRWTKTHEHVKSNLTESLGVDPSRWWQKLKVYVDRNGVAWSIEKECRSASPILITLQAVEYHDDK